VAFEEFFNPPKFEESLTVAGKQWKWQSDYAAGINVGFRPITDTLLRKV
jgi:hypothetical protein